MEYVPEFGRTVRIVEIDRPMQSDEIETAQTVSYMDEIAAADAGDRAVMSATNEALEQAGLAADASPLEKAHAVYWWLKRTIRYVPTPGTSPLVDQTLIAPTAVLAMPEPIGDCPQFSMLASAMFRNLCMASLYVTIAAEKLFPDQYSHIYNFVEVLPGRFMPFDSSNGPEPGAEYAKPFKRKVWPRIAPGACVNNQARSYLNSGKEGEDNMMRSAHPTARGMRNRALRGALRDVQCDPDGNCYTDGVLTSGGIDPNLCNDPSCMMTGPNPTQAQINQPIFPTTAPSSSPTGSGAGSIFQTLINDAAAVAAPLVRSATQQTPYYVTNPATGQSVLFNPNTGGLATGAGLGSISPTVLLFGALGIGALMLIGKK